MHDKVRLLILTVPLSTIYEFKRVSEFRRTNFNGRTGRSAIVSLSVGRDLDSFDCELYEFLPKDGKLQSYVNYYTSPSGCGMNAEKRYSANWELRSAQKSDMPQYIAYVDRLLESSLIGQPNFAHACYAGENSNFAKRLLILLIESYQQLELQVCVIWEYHTTWKTNKAERALKSQRCETA